MSTTQRAAIENHRRMKRRRAVPFSLLAVALTGSTLAARSAEPAGERARELVRMVRQDCGACHGMRLTGGLGPALTREAMVDKPLDSMTATIYGGRPGTPLPPWRAMMSEAEARWIAERLARGFPEEAPR